MKKKETNVLWSSEYAQFLDSLDAKQKRRQRREKLLRARPVIIAAAVALMLLLLAMPWIVYELQLPDRLSDLTEEACLEFLESRGVKLPYDADSYDWGAFVKLHIERAEEDPAYPHMAYGDNELNDLAVDIWIAVCEYHGIKAERPYP